MGGDRQHIRSGAKLAQLAQYIGIGLGKKSGVKLFS
jgi:hypothetical protein